MGVYWKSVPDHLLEWSHTTLGSHAYAIETGTYKGHSARRLAQHFERCDTIERDEILAKRAIDSLVELQNLKVHQGHTVDVLQHVIPAQEINVLFWLDAHYSAGITSGIDDPCPLDREVQIILRSRQAHNTIILIDDCRGLTGIGGWPTLGEIVESFTTKGFCVIWIDDVLVASAKENFADIQSQILPFNRVNDLEFLSGQKWLFWTFRRINKFAILLIGQFYKARSKRS
jgi:hypothetical protein